MSRVYLYALLSATPSCEAGMGVCAEPLRVVAVAGLVALVGDVGEVPEPSAITLRAQDTVLRRLAAVVDAVLPVRFGTLVADDAALAESLAPRQPQLAQAEQHIVVGRERLARQVRLVERLADRGHGTSTAELLSREMGRSLRLMRQHRAYLLDQMAAVAEQARPS